MRLLFAIKNLSSVGGAERVLCVVCSELLSRGHQVSILSFDPPGTKAFYPLDPRVKKIALNLGNSSKPARFFETVIRVRGLRRVIINEKPDVAVGFMHSMYVPLAFSAAWTGVPVLGSEHIVPQHYRARPIQYLLLILASPLLSGVTVLSQSIRLKYPAIVRRRMLEIPNPIEVATGSAKVGLAKDNFTLLSVGRLETQKDHVTLLRAFARVTHSFPHWRLKILGEGSLRTELMRLIRDLNIQRAVSMPGVTHNISNEYLASEIFVISSRYEALGLATAEAMSHGLPVIGFADCPGTNELIERDKTGLLVLPGTDRVGALASALAKLMSEPSLRRNLGRAGQEAIKRKFSVDKVSDDWERLLCSLSKKTMESQSPNSSNSRRS